jgi:diketogulonate reductase-like aldo/keto reductase
VVDAQLALDILVVPASDRICHLRLSFPQAGGGNHRISRLLVRSAANAQAFRHEQDTNRAGEDELALYAEHDIAFMPFFPLGSAFTGGPKQLAADPAVAAVADKHGATPSQIALAWLLRRCERVLLIPGTSSISHLEENMVAGEIELDAQEMGRLDEARQLGDSLATAEH